MKQYLNFRYSRRIVSDYSLSHTFGQIFKKIEIGFFILLSLLFIVLSKNTKNFADNISFFFIEVTSPVVAITSFPFNTTVELLTNFEELVSAKEDNEKLKEENEKLKALLVKTIDIKSENDELRNLIKLVEEKKSDFVAAHVVGRTQGLFSQKIFLDKGKSANIAEGDVVAGTLGLIGRVVDVRDDESRLMLPIDANSRIPIVTTNARARAVLAGNNSNEMQLLYLAKNHGIEIGDTVFTSGDGDAMLPGILVGTVTKVDGKYVGVEMAEDIANVETVSVLQFRK